MRNLAPLPLRWTPAHQLIFLVILQRTGSPAEAAAAAGLSRESAYRYRKRHPGGLFDLAWRHLDRERFLKVTANIPRL